jgi:predicted metal-dependent hydrolase
MNTCRVGERELVIDGRVVVVRVRESRRARRMRLTVGRGRPPEVVVPSRVRCRAVDDFLQTHERWLAAQLEALRLADQRPRVLPERLGSVWLAGEPVPVVHEPAGRMSAGLRSGQLVVGGAAPDASAAIERWYRREARRMLTSTVEREASRLEVRPQAISVRDQRTRWGSCSRDGRLSFSWRLVLAPSWVSDYVVVHELCHVRVFNHSRAFWSLVGSVRPGWQDAASWLREHGHELHAYRPASALAALAGQPTGDTAPLNATTMSHRPTEERIR